ncbi:MAG: PTS sugar transporter subunit IIA [Candidatus Zixiibacteriota bacterium]|nr:MAG: PTS sugar transporter subunit IIA [candidate division Zixibacteria bacterium]
MNLSRYFTEDLIKLEMTTVIDPPGEEESLNRWRQRSKELIIEELVSLLEVGNRIGNRNKLLIDFINRERKATTAIGHGVAVPHVRSMQAKEFMIAFARSTEGYDFEALDGNLSHMFFIMAAPPYDDTLYLKVFKSLAEMLQYESFREELMSLHSPGELIRALRAME